MENNCKSRLLLHLVFFLMMLLAPGIYALVKLLCSSKSLGVEYSDIATYSDRGTVHSSQRSYWS